MPDRSWGGAMAAAAFILLGACGPRTGEVTGRQPAPASEKGVELISAADSEAAFAVPEKDLYPEGIA